MKEVEYPGNHFFLMHSLKEIECPQLFVSQLMRQKIISKLQDSSKPARKYSGNNSKQGKDDQ